MKLGAVIPYLKKIKKKKKKKIIWHTPWLLLLSAYFSSEINKFYYIEKYKYRLHFNLQLLVILTLKESLKVALTAMIAILMMSAKLATLGLLKIKEFWNNNYDVISFDHGITRKIFSRESNYGVDVVMWPKFGSSNISMRETS